jgi:cytochrome P450
MTATRSPHTGAQHCFVLGQVPGRLPLLGHLPRIQRDPLGFFTGLREYGDIVTFGLGPATTYHLTHPDLIRRVLVDDVRKFDKGVQFDKVRAVTGDGLTSSREPLHMRQRRLIQPAFHPTRIAGYIRDMHQITEHRMASWRPGEVIGLDLELQRITMTITARALFRTDVDGAFVAEVLRSLPPFLDGMIKRMLYPLKILEKLPTRANRGFETARVRLGAAVNRIIDEYWHERCDRGDMLSMLREARDEHTGEQMSRQQIFDEVMTMLLAGTETAASSLSWACYLLSIHPDVQQRVAHEVDQVLVGQRAATADLPRLEYTRKVLTEAMRLYPAAWILTRRVVVDTELGGHVIPAGSNVFFCPYAVHRDPGLYPEPDRFDPQRWTGEAKGQARGYLPFGAGNRNCIGEGFAWTEMSIIMADVLSRWTLHPVAGQPVRPEVVGSLRPAALPMRLEQRR